MAATVITNIGTIVSGLIDQPILKGDVIVIKDGKIESVGGQELIDALKKEAVEIKTIDAGGMTVTPGLIDSHTHPVIGDYTPRQKMADFIESSIHGGVTTMISAGEVHTPGRPTDPAGVKALAILANKSFALLKPGGVKVIAGSVILEKGLTEADFAEMAAAGVRTVGEVGLGSVKKPEDAAPGSLFAKWKGALFIKLAEYYRRPLRQALINSRRFAPPLAIGPLAELAARHVSLGHLAGEGWLLTAEMVELIESGATNIICMQPFACLPNHITGKGILGELRRRYPDANIVPIDYDPGASEVNQLNRIKLMLAVAAERLNKRN